MGTIEPMQAFPIKTRKIEPTDNLIEFIVKSIQLQDGDILCIVSKIVSLTEGRLVQLPKLPRGRITQKRYGKYAPNLALDQLIKKEADKLFPGEMYLAIKNGIIAPSAGIDTSNIPDGYAILWPKNAYKSAEKIRTALLKRTKLKKLGILIFDSFILPLRRGSTGIVLGYAGFRGIETYKNKKDLFGKKLRVTNKNIADNLASAATLLCGEGSESIPLVIVKDAPATFTNTKIRRSEIQMPPEKCLYKNFY